MAESRGGEEDRSFKEAYQSFYAYGRHYLSKQDAQNTLTSKEPKLRKKKENIAGLQLADVLAHPLTRDVLKAYGRLSDRGGPFADAVAAQVERHYNFRYGTGKIEGYGRVILA